MCCAFMTQVGLQHLVGTMLLFRWILFGESNYCFVSSESVFCLSVPSGWRRCCSRSLSVSLPGTWRPTCHGGGRRICWRPGTAPSPCGPSWDGEGHRVPGARAAGKADRSTGWCQRARTPAESTPAGVPCPHPSIRRRRSDPLSPRHRWWCTCKREGAQGRQE